MTLLENRVVMSEDEVTQEQGGVFIKRKNVRKSTHSSRRLHGREHSERCFHAPKNAEDARQPGESEERSQVRARSGAAASEGNEPQTLRCPRASGLQN